MIIRHHHYWMLMLATCLLQQHQSSASSMEAICETEEDDDHSQANSDVCTTADCVIAAGSLLSTMNPKTNPCDNFYEYACGNIESLHSIPAGDSRFRQFNVVDRIIQRNLFELLEEPEKSGECTARKKARRYYKACMNVERIVNASVPWFQKLVRRMGGLFLRESADGFPPNWNLNALLAFRNKYTLNGPFTTTVGSDDRNVLQNIIKMEQGGLGLGEDSRDYYLDKDVVKDPIMEAYGDLLQTYAELIVGKANVDRGYVVKTIEFEQQLAAIHRPQHDQQAIALVYFKTNILWLQRHAGFIDWLDFFNELFAKVSINVTMSEPVLLYNSPYFRALNTLMSKYLSNGDGKRTLHNYFVFRAISMYAPYLGGEFQEARDKFLAVLMGKQGSLERWQTCVGDTDGNVGFGLGSMYVEKYFPQRDKELSESVVVDLIAAFRRRIKLAPWMDKATRAAALEKIDALTYDVAYPNWLRNASYIDNYYATLQVTDDFVQNQYLSYNDATRRVLRAVREKPDPMRWLMTPQTINAYYEQTQNKIVIPAGILNRPYFYPTKGLPSALNYGAIGCVAGHEISHGFDNIGREYDKLGNLYNWWSNVTRQQFEQRAKCLVEKFDNYQVDGTNLRGEQTLPENIADDAGVKAAYQAFKKAQTDGRTGRARKLVGSTLNEDQLFFVAWAQQWCSIYSPKMIQYMILQDSHSLFSFRVIGPLSNSVEFARTFNCPPGSPMNPNKKCNVW